MINRKWKVDDLGCDFFAATNHRWGIGDESDPIYRVAKIEGLGSHAYDNARLIAAAPELLEACKMLLTCCLPRDVSGKAIIENARKVVIMAEAKTK